MHLIHQCNLYVGKYGMQKCRKQTVCYELCRLKPNSDILIYSLYINTTLIFKFISSRIFSHINFWRQTFRKELKYLFCRFSRLLFRKLFQFTLNSWQLPHSYFVQQIEEQVYEQLSNWSSFRCSFSVLGAVTKSVPQETLLSQSLALRVVLPQLLVTVKRYKSIPQS